MLIEKESSETTEYVDKERACYCWRDIQEWL